MAERPLRQMSIHMSNSGTTINFSDNELMVLLLADDEEGKSLRAQFLEALQRAIERHLCSLESTERAEDAKPKL